MCENVRQKGRLYVEAIPTDSSHIRIGVIYRWKLRGHATAELRWRSEKQEKKNNKNNNKTYYTEFSGVWHHTRF